MNRHGGRDSSREQDELQQEIRIKILEIIETGQGLTRWMEAREEEMAKRKQVLEKLKTELIK